MAAGADAPLHVESNDDGRVRVDNFAQLSEFRNEVDKLSGKHDFRVVLEMRQTASRDEGEDNLTFRWIASQPDAISWTGNDQRGATGVSDSSRLRLQVIEMTADQLLSEVTTISIDSSSSNKSTRALLHPAFADRRNNFVFHSLTEVSRVLVEAQKVIINSVCTLLNVLVLINNDTDSVVNCSVSTRYANTLLTHTQLACSTE
jgi:hypothetical protein